MRLDRNNIRERVKNTMMETLKMSFEENDNDTIEVTMPVGRHNCQTMDVLHGGATISLAETAAGIGSNLLCKEDEGCFGIQISANHISSAKIGEVVRAIGTPVHIGRSTHVWDVEIFTESDKRLISKISVTNFVVPYKRK